MDNYHPTRQIHKFIKKKRDKLKSINLSLFLKLDIGNVLSSQEVASKYCGLRAKCGGLLQKERQFFDAKSEDTFNASNQAFASAGLYDRVRDDSAEEKMTSDR